MTRALMAAIALCLAAPFVHAQNWPVKPVRLVLPFAPGGPVDGMARIWAPRFGERIGQAVIVENRAGAAGNIGAEAVQKAPGDGYTILYVVPGILTNPYFFKGSPSPLEFSAITQLFNSPLVLLSSNQFPAKTTAEVLAQIKANPGKVSCASSGALPTVGCELLRSYAKTDMIMVLYKGNGPALQALMSGEVNLLFDAASTALVQVKGGRVRPIATAAPKRGIAAFPDLPAVQETLVDFYFEGWHGIMGPPNMPRDLVQRVNRELGATVRSPEVAKPVIAQGFEVVATSPEAFAERVKNEFTRFGKVLNEAGIKPE
jgi:tripartite-type tricarboxylate transporter receptor subunit TctC